MSRHAFRRINTKLNDYNIIVCYSRGFKIGNDTQSRARQFVDFGIPRAGKVGTVNGSQGSSRRRDPVVKSAFVHISMIASLDTAQV